MNHLPNFLDQLASINPYLLELGVFKTLHAAVNEDIKIREGAMRYAQKRMDNHGEDWTEAIKNYRNGLNALYKLSKRLNQCVWEVKFKYPKQKPRSLGEVRSLVNAFCSLHRGSSNSFAHLVLGDLNLEDHHIHFCLQEERIADWREQSIKDGYKDTEWMEKEIKQFLEYLLTIDEDLRVEWEEE